MKQNKKYRNKMSYFISSINTKQKLSFLKLAVFSPYLEVPVLPTGAYRHKKSTVYYNP